MDPKFLKILRKYPKSEVDHSLITRKRLYNLSNGAPFITCACICKQGKDVYLIHLYRTVYNVDRNFIVKQHFFLPTNCKV